MDEQLLNAYIDGELDETTTRVVKQSLLADSSARAYVESVKQINRLSRVALDAAVCDMPLPPALENRVPESRVGTPRKIPNRQGYFALAASVALLAVGYAGGFITAENRFQERILALHESRNQSLMELSKALGNVLEYTPSGTSVHWESEKHNASADLTPLRTLQTSDQRYCREFQEIRIVADKREERRGISCRHGKENWQTRLLIQGSEKAVF